MKMKPLFILSLCCLCLQAFGEEYTYRLASPDKNLEVNISVGQKITYSVRHKDRVLLNASPIGLVFLDRTLGADAKVIRKKESSFTEDIQSPHYRVPSFTVTYNELDLKMKGNYGVVFRAYNEGMAYRFYTTMKDSVIVEDEIASFNFPENYTSYMAYSTAGVKSDQYAMAFQNTYTVSTVKEAEADHIAFLPITLDCGDEVKMTLLESDLESYPGMFIEKGNGESCSLKATFARYPKALKRFPPRAMTKVVERADYIAKAAGKRNYPWRIWAVTEKDTEMPVNNLVYALASPNRIGDCSWIKTGKVAWEWWNDWGISGVGFKAGINMDTYKHYIDFAAENGIEFVVLDEGWYNPAKGDMLAVIPELNLEELVRYGKSKGVDLILWTVFNVLDEQLEEACRKYSAMGISGFKVDFLDRDDQTAVEMACRIAEMTAKYRLTLHFIQRWH